MSKKRFTIPTTVIALGAVSFFTDFSSEMIYPLLPLFLTTQLGAGVAILGVIEGIAESTAAILKLFSGVWADRVQKNKPLVLAGYGLSGAVRPLIGLATAWPAVLAIRFGDRIGKGLRTSPRDALITDVTDESMRGRAFGFHRAMDHAGSVIGPLVASSILFVLPKTPLRHIFFFAAVPALAAFLVLWFFVKDRKSPASRSSSRPPLQWHVLTPNFKLFLAGILLFTLGNSTDAFLLLRLNRAGVDAKYVTLLWALHSAVKVVSTYYGGRMADRLGDKKLIVGGWVLYALIYLAFSFTASPPLIIALFITYGIYFGLTEPAEKAFVSKLCAAEERGTAFGFYHLIVGISALPASLIFGWVWQTFGFAAAFQTGAALAVGGCLILSSVSFKRPAPASSL